MKEAPMFSVVMPVYNVELYLRQAIESVLHQTYKDFEIILVNDCSPDDSESICLEYSEKHPNIVYTKHLKNMGLSAARNTGLRYVQGQYVWFMDSDDYVEKDLLQSVYDSLNDNEADVVLFGCKEDYYNKKGILYKSLCLRPQKRICKTSDEVHKEVLALEINTFYGYAWNKFYRVSKIRENHLEYKDIVLIEDIDFNVRFFNFAEKLNVLAIAPYHYAKRGSNSLTAKFVPDYFKVHRERVRMLYEQQKSWGTAGNSEKSILAGIYTRYIFSALSRNCDRRSHMSHHERKQWLDSLYKDKLFLALIPYSKPEGRTLKVLSALLKKKKTLLCLITGKIIFFIQKNVQPVFVKIKQERS